jgi:amidohydrolase
MIEQLVQEVVAPTGAIAEVSYVRGVPPVMNDARSIATLAAAATAAAGPESVADTPQSLGGEDFSWYLEHVRGAMARLGVGRPGESLDLHQGTFDVDEDAIAVGVRLLVHAAVAALTS